MTHRLSDVGQFLTTHLLSDPQYQLAVMVTTLDPLWQRVDIDWDSYPEDYVSFALHTIRELFPLIYVDAMQAIQQNKPQAEIEGIICEGINASGIPLDEIEWMLYGIPIPAYGVDLEDMDWIQTHTEYHPLLTSFGLEIEPDEVHIPQYTYRTAYVVSEDLLNQTDHNWQHVGWLLGHLFSCTNNSAIDWSVDEMESIDWLTWDADGVDFAIAIIEEAHEILEKAELGLAWCQSHPTFVDQLTHNFKLTYTQINQRQGQYNDLQLTLDWHTPGGCAD